MMTPVDMLKTRMSISFFAIEPGVAGCLQQVMTESGWKALYDGAGSRILFSGAFAAIGFGTFEAAKKMMGISDIYNTEAGTGNNRTTTTTSAPISRGQHVKIKV
jgi:hypothetical protein